MPDNSNWDKLEFVVARKLLVQYLPKQVIIIIDQNLTSLIHPRILFE